MIPITADMKTGWYPPVVKPVREGVYELQSYLPHRKVFVAYWNGGQWMNSDIRWLTVDRGEWCKWRGLKTPHDGETS